MSFTANTSSPDRVLVRLRNLVRQYGSSMRNIHKNVGPTQQDRWGNFSFDAESTGGTFHDCAVTIRVMQTEAGKCLVEVLARDTKCDRDGHVREIEDKLYGYY